MPPSAADALEYLWRRGRRAINGDYVDFGGSFAYTRREALGVCVGIGAWNYPIQGAGWKSAPALAMGNAMVFKPSENTPLSALALAEIYTEAGLPNGLFNVVQGYGDVGAALASHPVVAKVSLTGSVPTGRKVLGLAGSLMKHATMELGGKSPLIIFDDADVENAVGGAMLANFYSTGQVCSNGTRVFVQNGLHDRFLDRLTERTKAIRIGDPLDPETQMGPLINKAQHEKVLSYIEIGKQEGATLHHGGGVPSLQGFEAGFFVEPTIFTGVTDDMRIAREEIFGPVMSVLKFERRGRGRRPRQRHRVRPVGRRVHPRPAARPPRDRRPPGGHLLDQPLQPRAGGDPVRRLQAVGHRPRKLARRARPLLAAEIRLCRNRRRGEPLLRSAFEPAPFPSGAFFASSERVCPDCEPALRRHPIASDAEGARDYAMGTMPCRSGSAPALQNPAAPEHRRDVLAWMLGSRFARPSMTNEVVVAARSGRVSP